MDDKQKYYESLYKNNGSTNSTRPTMPYNTSRSTDEYSITYIDTVKVEEIEKDLVKLARDYNEKIAKMFQRLNDVPGVTKEWVGNQANFYFSVISGDKSKFLNFGNNLRDIASKLDADLSKVTGSVNRLVRLEEEARYNDQI